MTALHPWQRRVLDAAGLNPDHYERESIRITWSDDVTVAVTIGVFSIDEFDRMLRDDNTPSPS